MSTDSNETEASTDFKDTASKDTASKDTDTRGPDQIEADIERDRARLGETVDELTSRLEETKEEVQSKLDVKKQAKAKWASVKDQARHRGTSTTDGVRTAVQDPQQRAELGAKAAPVLAGVSVVALMIGLLRRRFFRGAKASSA